MFLPNKKATMKNSSVILLALLLSVAAVFTTSCKKKGCTNPEAINYSEEAEKDDGSCSYGGGMVFFYDEATAAQLVQDGAITMTYYVDGKEIGSSDAALYWTGPPDCGQDGSVGIDKYWENDRTKTYSFSAQDQTGWEFWGNPVTFHANTCVTMQLMANKRKKK
jgi:hypothetical protein